MESDEKQVPEIAELGETMLTSPPPRYPIIQWPNEFEKNKSSAYNLKKMKKLDNQNIT